MERKDIQNLEDIRLLVDTFYKDVQLDPLIGPIFIGVIQNRWDEHLAKMYRFWQTILLDEHTYSGSPFLPHASMPLQQPLFDRWLSIWNHTIDRFFEGPMAEEARWRGARMAEMFLLKLEHARQRSTTFLK